MNAQHNLIQVVANIEDSQLIQDLLDFIDKRQRENPPPPGSYEAFMRHRGVLSDEDAQEMREIIDREFNNIEGEW